MPGGEPQGDKFFQELRGQLSEKVDEDGQPDPNGEPRGMSEEARTDGHEPLQSSEQVEAAALAQVQADKEAAEGVRSDIAAS